MADDEPMDQEERMMRTLMASAGAMFDAVRPVHKAQILAVLERNETIVHQAPAALDHLAEEILDAIFHIPEIPEKD